MADGPWLWTYALVVCSFLINQVEAGAYCTTSYSSTSYCASDCCGSYGNQYCCGDEHVWLIIGCLLAGIFVISVIVIVVCYVIKRKGRPGRVISPGTQAPTTSNITVFYPGTPSQYPGPQPQYGAQPMGMQPMPPQYGNPDAAPPAYNYSDPVYPPPPRA